MTDQSSTAQLSVAAFLDSLDTSDDDAAGQLFGWLVKTQRVSKVGTLDGVGDLLRYDATIGARSRERTGR